MSAGRGKSYQCPNCGRRVTTQLAYVRHLLEEAGGKGVTTNEFLRWGAGSRFGARVHELRHNHQLFITEENELYTLVGVVGATGSSATPPAQDSSRGGAHETYEDLRARVPEICFDPWERVFMCPSCAYAVVASSVCPRGHEAVLGWHADLRPPAVDALAEAA